MKHVACLVPLVLCVMLATLTTLPAVDARRIVALGDLHGDYNQSLAVLRLTGIVDEFNHWVGEDTYLVQLGDVLDVGPDDIRIVSLLMRLQKEAQAKGGDVIELLGNHEIRNFKGDYTAVDPGSLSFSGGQAGRDKLLSNTSKLGLYLRTRKAIFRYGPFLFMHGGISDATSSMITSIDKVDEFNAELQKALVNGTLTPMGQNGLDLTEDEADEVANPILVRSILNVRCRDLKRVLDKKFPGIQSVVVGHVPHDPRDFSDWRLCEGRLIDIDFGLSRWKKGDPGHVAALEIEEGTWHVQLIEASVPVAIKSNFIFSFTHRLFRFLVFTFLVVLAAITIVYILRRVEGRKKANQSILPVNTEQYGTV